MKHIRVLLHFPLFFFLGNTKAAQDSGKQAPADFFKDTKAKKYQQQTAVKQHHFDIRTAIRS